MAPMIMNCIVVLEEENSTVNPDKAVHIWGFIPISSIYTPRIIPPPIPKVPDAIPVINAE